MYTQYNTYIYFEYMVLYVYKYCKISKRSSCSMVYIVFIWRAAGLASSCPSLTQITYAQYYV